MPSKLHRFLQGGWNAMSKADTRIYYEGAWHDPCSGPRTLWHYQDGAWHKFPCEGAKILYSLYYYNATFDEGPFPGEQQDYTHIAWSDETNKDVFLNQDPNWDQGYAVWSPDQSKICYIRADRQSVSSAVWPGSDDLTYPIPRQPPGTFPTTPSHGTSSNGNFNQFDAGQPTNEIWVEVSPVTGTGSRIDLYVGYDGGSNGLRLRVQHNADDTWDFSVYDLNTASNIYSNSFPAGYFSGATGFGFELIDGDYSRIMVQFSPSWYWYFSVYTPTIPTGHKVGVDNNGGANGTWGGGAYASNPLYSLMVIDADGSNEITLKEDVFGYPAAISYDNSMICYGATIEQYTIDEYRIINTDGTDDRSLIPGFHTFISSFANSASLVPWTPTGKLAFWAFESPGGASVTMNELRLYEPDGSGDYVVAYDALADAIARGIDPLNWRPQGDGDVGSSNKYVIAWRSPGEDTGYTDSNGNPITVPDQLAIVVPCEEDATPLFIKADDVPWKDWPIWTSQTQVGGFDPGIPSASPDDSDDFNRADEYLDDSPNWITPNLTSANSAHRLVVASNTAQGALLLDINQGLFIDAGIRDAGTAHHGFANWMDLPYGTRNIFSSEGPCLIALQQSSYVPSPREPAQNVFEGGYTLMAQAGTYASFGYTKFRLFKTDSTGEVFGSELASNEFVYHPYKMALRIYGGPSVGDITIEAWYNFNGANNGWFKVPSMTVVDSSPLYTSGYVGLADYNASGTTPMDNFAVADVIVPDPVYASLPNNLVISEPFWSSDGSMIMCHQRTRGPGTWDRFNEEMALAFDPNNLNNYFTFSYDPNDPSTPEFSSGNPADWQPEDSTPIYAYDAYIPTWYGNKAAMTASYYLYDPSPGVIAQTDSFQYITAKEQGGIPYWLVTDTTDEQGWISPYIGPDYLKGGFVVERMLITGVNAQTYYEDETLT